MEIKEIKTKIAELLAGTNSNDLDMDIHLHSKLQIWAKAEPGDQKAKVESDIKNWAEGSQKKNDKGLKKMADQMSPEGKIQSKV